MDGIAWAMGDGWSLTDLHQPSSFSGGGRKGSSTSHFSHKYRGGGTTRKKKAMGMLFFGVVINSCLYMTARRWLCQARNGWDGSTSTLMCLFARYRMSPRLFRVLGCQFGPVKHLTCQQSNGLETSQRRMRGAAPRPASWRVSDCWLGVRHSGYGVSPLVLNCIDTCHLS